MRNPVLIGLELVAGSVWVGSLVCLAVVAAAARSSLDPGARVAFLRSLGRRYGIVGTSALTVSIAIGLALLWPPSLWGRAEDASVALAGVLVAATAVGIRQARAMSRLRRSHLADFSDQVVARRVRRGARLALILRGLIAAVTLAIVALVATILGD